MSKYWNITLIRKCQKGIIYALGHALDKLYGNKDFLFQKHMAPSQWLGGITGPGNWPDLNPTV